MFDEHNPPKWASAQSLEPVEIIQACCALGDRQQTDDWNASLLIHSFIHFYNEYLLLAQYNYAIS